MQSYQTANDLIERAEMRDAWLGVLLPVAVSALLLLLLIVYRRRRGSATPDGLFSSRRLPDLRAWWSQGVAAAGRRRETARARERMDREAIVAAAERRAREAEETAARQARRIVGLDGKIALLEVGQRVRVDTTVADRDGRLSDISETGLTVSGTEMPWDHVRQVSIRVGHERRWWIPITLATIAGGLLGLIGGVLQEVSSSASPANYLLAGLGIGALAGGGFGMLIMYAFAGPRWRTIVRAPAGTPPLSLSTFAARAATLAPSPADDDSAVGGVEIIARTVLLLIAFATCSFFS